MSIISYSIDRSVLARSKSGKCRASRDLEVVGGRKPVHSNLAFLEVALVCRVKLFNG